MKPLVLILTQSDADGKAIADAAVSRGSKVIRARSVPEALGALGKGEMVLFFCDAALAEGGGVFRSLGEARSRSGVSVILIVPQDIKPGLVKALRPWVHDYLSTPVLREAAMSRIRNLLREQELERAVGKAVDDLTGWLASFENSIRYFEPLSYEKTRAQDELARRLLRNGSDDTDRPQFLMIGVPDGRGCLLCDLYCAVPQGADAKRVSLKIPETALFLRIKAGDSPACLNAFDRGAQLRDFQAAFPPELLEITGSVRNLSGVVHGGTYVIAMNYGRPASPHDALYLKGLSLPANFLGAVAGTVREVSESFLVMINALAVAADSMQDNGAHIRRMNQYARVLALQMSLPAAFIKTLAYSAQLHDVGKICIHPDVLAKPIRLTAHEFEIVKKHPLLGAKILGDTPLLRMARTIALTHHEAWDGSGYPVGLSGDAIPVEGAIVKLADVYDALRTMHSYKAAYSHDDACRFILDGGGDDHHEIHPSQFHPDVLRAFRTATGSFEEIYSGAR